MLLPTLLTLLSLAALFCASPLPHHDFDLPPRDSAGCPLARRVYPEFPRAYHGSTVPDNNYTIAVTLGIGNVTYTCTKDSVITTHRAPLYDIAPLLLKTSNQTREKRSLVLHSFLTGQPPVGQSPNGYLGFHSPISYTNTTPTSSGDETPRTVQLPSFTLYRSSPACPSEGRNEKQGTFVRVGDFPSPNNPKDNVDWRQYEVIEGNSYATRNSGIAPTVLRTDTKGGAQKKKCLKPGQIEVAPFVAIYWFFR